MIKKIALTIFILLIPFILLMPLILLPTLAQTPTESPAELSQSEKEKIDDLKERVATRVAQLRSQTTYKALIGEVKSADKESLTLKTKLGEKKILTTEETKIFKITGSRKSAINLANVKAGDRAAVVGSTDPEGTFVAKLIFTKAGSLNTSGVIEKIDRDNAIITVKNSQKGTTYLVDIETTTKIRAWKKDGGFEKLGFSKVNVGDRVHIHGLPQVDEENRISAIRILVLPGATPSVLPEVSPTKTP